MAELDLEKLRAERDAARREEQKEQPVLRIAGEAFELPFELPLDLAWAIEEGTLSRRKIAQQLLGEVAYEKFMATNPTAQDWQAIDNWLVTVYLPSATNTAGESDASGAS